MADATQEMIALANSIREEFWPDFDNAVLAAIQATTERAAEWLDRLSTEIVTPDFLAFVGDPFGRDGQAMCGDIAKHLRAAAHLKEQSA